MDVFSAVLSTQIMMGQSVYNNIYVYNIYVRQIIIHNNLHRLLETFHSLLIYIIKAYTIL